MQTRHQHTPEAPHKSIARRFLLATLERARALYSAGGHRQPGMGHKDARHIYAGTVSYSVKQRRRARNKMARKSRRINRQHAKR